jgi:hypothetical protein
MSPTDSTTGTFQKGKTRLLQIKVPRMSKMVEFTWKK